MADELDSVFKDYDGMNYSDEGEITFTQTEEADEESGLAQPDTEETEETEESSGEDEQPEGEATEEEPAPVLTPEVDPVKQENQLLRQYLAAMLQQLQSRKTTEKSETPETEVADDVDLMEIFSDAKKGQKYLQHVVRGHIQEAMKPLTPILQDYQLRQELQTTVAKYPDFMDNLETIKNVSTTYPQLTYEQCYLLVKQLMPKQAASQKEEAKTTPRSVKPTKTLKDLQKRAQKLKTEEGVSGTLDQNKGIHTVEDAFDAALAELGIK